MTLTLDTPHEEFGHTWLYWRIVCVQLHMPLEGVPGAIFEYHLANDDIVWPEVFRVSSENLTDELDLGGPVKAFEQSAMSALKAMSERNPRKKARK
jgi:hypothetical protein